MFHQLMDGTVLPVNAFWRQNYLLMFVVHIVDNSDFFIGNSTNDKDDDAFGGISKKSLFNTLWTQHEETYSEISCGCKVDNPSGICWSFSWFIIVSRWFCIFFFLFFILSIVFFNILTGDDLLKMEYYLTKPLHWKKYFGFRPEFSLAISWTFCITDKYSSIPRTFSNSANSAGNSVFFV